jgi:chemotaxis-related protein WspB
MLWLAFAVRTERYALESRQVVEVVPLVTLRRVPKAPDYLAGLLNYHSRLVPVLDLCQLLQGQPCPARLSTRIILVHYQRPNRPLQILGLMAERVTDTVTTDSTVPLGIKVDAAPYLGDMITDEHGMLQCVQVEHLLPAAVHALLFPDEAE